MSAASSTSSAAPGNARLLYDRFREPFLTFGLAVLGLWITFNVLAFVFGQAPLATLGRAFDGTWGTPYGIGQVLFKASPLIFTGFAFHLAERTRLFNIGAEGQLAAASLFGAAFAAALPPTMPAALALLLTLLVAAVTGALVALPPALMRAHLGVHEVISGIMMNRIVEVLLPLLLATVLGNAAMRTLDIPKGATLLRLDQIFPSLKGSAASLAFPIAVFSMIAFHFWLRKSRLGREMGYVGQNAEACAAEGIPVKNRLVLAMLLSGAFAGLGMSATVLGYKGYFEIGLGSGAGFAGISVVLLGRGNPIGIVIAAVFFGTLQQAGLAINARVPKEAMAVLEAIAILFVSAAGNAAKRKNGGPARESESKKAAAGEEKTS